MKKNYQKPQTEIFSVKGSAVMLVISGGSADATLPGMESWNSPGIDLIIWDELSN